MNEKSVDVLAVLDQALEDCEWLVRNSIKTMEVSPTQLREARDAVAELIEAASNVGAYTDHDSWVRLRAALARCGGQP